MDNPNRRADDKRAPGQLQWSENGEGAAPALDWIQYGHATDTLRIHGYKYSGELFRGPTLGLSIGETFKIVNRADGVLTIERTKPSAPASADNPSTAGAAEPERLSTDESREYLVKFTEQYFTDKTFHRYIRNDPGNRQGLAGDFAWQLARALRMILAAPVAQSTAGIETKMHFWWRQDQAEWRECFPDAPGAVEFVGFVPAGYAGISHPVAAPVAQSTAGAAKPVGKVVETDIDVSVIDAVLPIGAAVYLAAPAAQATTPADELRKAVRAIVQLVRDGEWADLLHTDADAVELWSAVDGLLQRAAQLKREMPPEMKAAIKEAHKTGATSALLPNGSAVFINYGHDYGDNDHLCCTACGGSGHIDDQQASQGAGMQVASIPTWQQRCGDTGLMPSKYQAITAMKAEIADLRAQLARNTITIDSRTYTADEIKQRIIDLNGEAQAVWDQHEQGAQRLQVVEDQLARQGQGQPVLYVRQIDLESMGNGRNPTAARAPSGDWNVPVYLASPAQASAAPADRDWINDVVRDVAELPDRDSPEGQPDMMLVTFSELHNIIARHAPASAAPGQARAAVPDGFVLMPKRLTAENGAKGALSGEFKESIRVTCHECDGTGEGENDEDCIECKGEGTVDAAVTVSWDTIKDIYKRAVELLAASPEPATAAVPAAAGAGGLYAAALLAVERMRGCAATYIEDHAKDTYPGQIGLRPQDVAAMWAQEINGIDAKAYLDEAIDDLKVDKARAAQPVEQPTDDARDAARLDFLDTNVHRFRMGWEVGAAPVGNLSVLSIIMGGKPIREAIDAAMQASKGATDGAVGGA